MGVYSSTMKSKAKACLYTAVSSTIFTRIMSLKSPKEVWDYLKTEYEGYETIRGMQVVTYEEHPQDITGVGILFKDSD